MSDEREGGRIGRREIMKWSAAGVVAGRLVSQPARLHARAPGAAERIRLGLIGAGRQGVSDLGNAMKHPDVDAVAICDVYEPNLAKAAAAAPNAQRYGDFRRLLDRKDVEEWTLAAINGMNKPR